MLFVSSPEASPWSTKADVLRLGLPPAEGSDPTGGHWSSLVLQYSLGQCLGLKKQQIMDVEGSHLSERSWSGISEQMLSLKKR